MPANRHTRPGHRPARPDGGRLPAADGRATIAGRAPGSGASAAGAPPEARIGRLDCRLTVPGTPALVRVARRFVRTVLRDCPRVADIELVVSELMTNAIRHTPSGAAGAVVTLRLLAGAGWARVEIGDLGAPGGAVPARPPLPGEDRECGRGLAIVWTLADRTGRDPSADGQISWAEFAWGTPADPAVRRETGPPADGH